MLDRLAAARSHLEDPRTLSPAAPAIVDEWPGRRPVEPGATVVVLVHFDPRGVGASFEALVSEFVDSGCEVVVCSTSIGDPRLADAVREQVVSVCRVPNTGLDWGAYQAGLRYVLERFEPASVILANDSVYVIDGRLGAFIRRLEALPADLSGATDSDELGPHLQSYVLRLGPRALSGALTHELLTTYVPISVKELVIHSYELGFSRRGRLHGLDLAAVHPVSALSERAARTSAATESVLRRIAEGTALSPTLHLWKPLLEDGFPFVKRQLIRDRIASRDELLRFVPERTLALAEEDIRGRA